MHGWTTLLSVHVQGKHQSVETPDSIFAFLERLFGCPSSAFFDPCPLHPSADGLCIPWARLNFVNPPFRDTRAWIQKALRERDAQGACSVFLIPARTCTIAFHQEVFPQAHTVLFLLNPIRFKGYTKMYALPMALLVFGTPPAPGLRSSHPSVRLAPMPAYSVHCKWGHLEDDVLPFFRTWVLGSRDRAFDTERLEATDPDMLHAHLRGTMHWLVVLCQPREAMQRILEWRERTGCSGTTLVLLPARYNDRFMREQVVPHATELVFIRPLIKFRAFKAFLGSFVCVLGAPLPRERTTPGVCARTVSLVSRHDDEKWL